jgi:flagellar basal body-associated protein FliL
MVATLTSWWVMLIIVFLLPLITGIIIAIWGIKKNRKKTGK